ncbi:MAG TPA: ribonucleoside triphosphate reductase [Methanomicrobia archaeon]|nr:ribonucleoside triphosphate reductase [Methanomicrobia archaeon]HEX59162.1 ribonucleoside triphosphate reductase [Methanomicrobia archaeon]
MVRVVDEYINKRTWRVNENANRIPSIGGLKTYIAEKTIAKHTLSLYAEEVRRAHVEGAFHIHDLGHGIGGYCAGWNLLQLLQQGLYGGRGTLKSRPPKHFTSALGQLLNFIGVISQEWAGAQAVNSFDTLLAPFIRHDKLSYREVKQALQEFVFGLNVSLRFGHETPFTNITFDITTPKDLAETPVIIGGVPQDRTYEEFEEEREMLNRAFLEVLVEGDGDGAVFRFPIPTYNITEEFDWSDGFGELLAKATGMFGVPYFQNCIAGGLNPEDVRAMCCRLNLDLRELRRKTGGLFGYNDSTGSIGVVTLNLPQIAFLSAGDETAFFELLDERLELAKHALETKRRIVEENFERGLFPYTSQYLHTLDNHFLTVGVVGGEEMCRNFLDCSIADDEGKKFAVRVLKHIRRRLQEFQEESGHLYNLEATPAEGCSYRLAKIDKRRFGGEVFTSGTKRAPFYTNSTQLPVDYGGSLFDALRHQEELQSLYTGGTVFHIFFGEQVREDVCRSFVPRLITHICRNYRLPYLTFTPTYSVCRHCSRRYGGEVSTCPECGEECEVFSRVVGYYSPVHAWNRGKKEEWRRRRTYDMASVRL